MGFFGKLFGGGDNEAEVENTAVDATEEVANEAAGGACSMCTEDQKCAQHSVPEGSESEDACNMCAENKTCDSCSAGKSMNENNLDA
ncbi:MAG: hypothetical protein LR008_02540 [Candidatus Pacebacteria bacterium]|nr:hypothetical protein [Candidatus Paceibacterota bacterium]